MTEEEVDQLSDRFRKVRDIRNYVNLAEQQATPFARLSCLLGNTHPRLNKDAVQRAYEGFKAILEAEADKEAKELEALKL